MAYRFTPGRKVVAAAGTAEAIEDNPREVVGVIIVAEVDNTDYIAVGDSDVVESDSTRTGVPLAAGQSVTLYNADLNQIYLDSGANGDGVTYLYWG